MDSNFSEKIASAIREPQNMGEMAEADAVGTVGNAECGEMMRLWIKYKEEKGRRIIDRASFQSFGCETAIAVASLATQMLKGRTREEALAFTPGEMAPQLGPLPPMKIHCAELVQAALRAALDHPQPREACRSAGEPSAAGPKSTHLMDSIVATSNPSKPIKITFLDPNP